VDQVYSGCLTGKQHHTMFPRQAEHCVEEPMELVHGDLCGPITPASSSGSHYFLLLVDDCSCFMWLRTLQTKEQAASAIKLFQQAAERERDVTPATSVSHRPRQ
jgi:hypothetical protein